MLKNRIFPLFLCVLVILSLSGCAISAPTETTQTTVPNKSSGKIYLYGEQHGDAEILAKELDLWQIYYHEHGMRHLFIEYGYFTGAYLNLWMKAEDDTLLNALFADWEGTQAHTQDVLNFYKAIKETCPETVFHGTDVGHQFWSTGVRYLEYLEQEGLSSSEEYMLAQKAIEQGNTYYTSEDSDIYRKNTMTENFIREFDALKGESVMGIYGSAHTNPENLNYTGQCDSMAKQLHNHYGSVLNCEDLTQMLLAQVQPLRQETVSINGKDYTADYYGKQDLSALFPEYSSREFWRIQSAYADFCAGTFTGNVLPQSNYPMLLEGGQAYLVLYTYTDGTTCTEYHLCDGTLWNGTITTKEVKFN